MKNITISNQKLTVIISPLGAELQSITKDGAEYLWNGDPEIWQDRAPILFPVVGGLKNGEYNYKGKTYSLPQHGFARTCLFEVSKAEADKAVFTLFSNEETRQNYPFDFELIISYHLKESTIEVTYTVINKTEGEMFFSIGAHEGYCCPIEQHELFTDYYMEFDSPVTHNKYLIENRLILTESEEFLQNNNTFDLKHSYFETDALVFKNVNSKYLSLKSKKSKRGVKVSLEGFPFLGIWQKSGAPYICIEPWHGIADSINAGGDIAQKEGIIKLEQSGVFECIHNIEILSGENHV